MMKNIKPIQGRQSPNLIGPECIEVSKVYDWVVLTNRDRNKIPLSDACSEAIQGCLHLGRVATANCEITNPRCTVVGTRQPANIPGVPGAVIVTLGITADVVIRFFCDGAPLAGCPSLTQQVTFIDEVILCAPEGTTIECNVFASDCNVVFNQLLGDFVLIDVVLCKEVQVTSMVKLEVEAKFCGPRQAIPIEEVAPQCPPFPNFPEQCPTFFPPENCLCQGSVFLRSDVPSVQPRVISVVDGSGTLTPVSGLLAINNGLTGVRFGPAIICDQCTLSKSTLAVTFQDTPGGPDPAVDQSFTFTATEFNQPTCTTTPETLSVTGFGKFQLAGQAEQDVSFLLILNDTANTATLVISDISGTNVLVSATVFLLDIPNVSGVNVEACERFPQ
jgi:hypothetical protein